jgi:hypothetical protein
VVFYGRDHTHQSHLGLEFHRLWHIYSLGLLSIKYQPFIHLGLVLIIKSGTPGIYRWSQLKCLLSSVQNPERLPLIDYSQLKTDDGQAPSHGQDRRSHSPRNFKLSFLLQRSSERIQL